MTSIVAWERRVGHQTELVMASDSRLSGGEDWDGCAKIFDVGRDDALIAFAGNTWRALPLIFQAISTTRSYEGSNNRTLDLPKYAGHIVRVLNSVLAIASGPAADAPPECEFLLGGWSWSMGQFRIYKIQFDKQKWEFVISSPQRLPNSIGGQGRGSIYESIGDGSRRLTGRLAKAYNLELIEGPLDYHPLEQLYQQTIDARERTIGGAIQVSKVYRSIRVEHFAVDIENKLFVSGRPVLPTENVDLRVLRRTSGGQWSTHNAS